MTYHQITIVGNVGRDPELRYTSNGIAVTDFSVATSRRVKRGDDWVDETTWWRVTCWRRQAEIVAQYVKKGKQVLVIASKIEANAYMGRDGEARASLDVTADEVRFLSDGGSRNVRDDNVDTASGGYPQENDFAPPSDVDDIPF
ncbi:MAG: single-stranded DNA-binding protein [Chloroflexota bacterium]